MQKSDNMQQNVQVKFIKNPQGNQQTIGKLSIKINAQTIHRYSLSNNVSHINNNVYKVKIPFKVTVANNRNQIVSVYHDNQLMHVTQKKVFQGEEKEQIKLSEGNIQIGHRYKESLIPEIAPQKKLDLNHYIIEEQKKRYLQKISLENFIKILKQELNEPVFQVLLDQNIIKSILQQYSKCYFSHQQNQQVLEIITHYLSLSINYARKNHKFQTQFNIETFATQMGSAWLKIKEEIFNLNKRALKVLGYIQRKEKGQTSRYDHCFLDLKFDLSDEQTDRVSAAVKLQCRYNRLSFCFLSNYLLKCCHTLQIEQGLGIRQIESKLSRSINRLIRQNPLCRPLQGDDQLLQKHKNYTVGPQDFPQHTIHLKEIQKNKRVKTLQKYIYNRSLDSKGQFSNFNKLIRGICLTYGYNYKIALKIRGLKNRQSFQEVKEKIFKDIHKYQEVKSSIKLEVNPNKCLTEYTHLQEIQYKHQINTFFSSYETPIQFKISDILKAQCLFKSVDKINDCCSSIKEQIQRQGLTLLMLKNRLKTSYCDILLYIRLGNTIAELQLGINYKISTNLFHNKLERFLDSNGKNLLTFVREETEKETSQFLQEMESFIYHNINCSNPNDYNQEISFKQASQSFRSFSQMLPFHQKYEYVCENSFSSELFQHEIKIIKKILNHDTLKYEMSRQQINQRHLHNADFLYATKQYQKASEEYQTYRLFLQQICHNSLIEIHQKVDASQIQDIVGNTNIKEKEVKYLLKYAKVLHKLAIIQMNRKAFKQSIEYLKLSQKIIKYLNLESSDEMVRENEVNMIQIKISQQQYPEGLLLCQKLLDYQHRKHGHFSQETVETIKLKAKIYKLMQNYPQAIDQYKKSLAIQSQILGKENISLANVLIHLGNTYIIQGNLPEALQTYNRCLDIQAKEKGNQSLDCAVTLSNIALIYQLDGQYYQAIKSYEKSFNICKKFNSRDSMLYNSSYGLGRCNYELRNYTRAVEHFIKGLQFFKTNKPGLYTSTMNFIIKSYQSLGDEQSLSYYLDKFERQKLSNSRRRALT